MSLPADLVDEVRTAKSVVDSGSPALEQLAMADFIASGDYDRHVARARQVYRRRRDVMVDSVGRRLPSLRLDGAAAGLHLLLRLPDGIDDLAIARDAAERGVRVEPLSPMSLVGGPERGLVLGYSRLAAERIDGAIAMLAEVLASAGIARGEVRPRPRSPRRG
jgi:GntR family transcriptional regulator/MocR family aminotransferase